MHITFHIFSIIAVVICAVISVVQYYLLNQNAIINHGATIKNANPVFQDFIISGNNPYYALGYETKFIVDNEVRYRRNITNNSPNNEEVKHCLRAAIKFKSSGKIDKALKLFEHAVAIAPNNPDVLNRFGEYLEHMKKDIVTADEMYFKVNSGC